MVTKFSMKALNICGASVVKWLHVTHLVPSDEIR